ncbi:SNF2 family N-terminal domain-containing protein [Boeremia exigua]|uniref:SNF2 family N-terminal domain-containing protein n=1 Tax=Boeremia exigua TaxID=749465 RepID=UPI001E8E5E1F|nr:SNF2 family N-terminal domain-containing protein [Boeremia exigua]KAH6643098.1 SNF2 family N-terminal domain-containing protein [Boeremia exigua]
MEPGTPAGDAHSTPHHEPSSADSEHAAPHGASTHTDVKVPIKEEAAAAALDGIDDARVTPRPAKRRRVESSTSRSTSRAASPPWKSFSAHGPTTVFENGVRKSSRVNRDALPPTPEPAKRAARHAPKTPQANGAPKSGTPKSAAAAKKLGPPNGVKKPIPAPANKAFAPALSTPASRKSERQRRPPAPAPARASPPTSPVLRHASPEGARKRTARTRRATHTSTQDTADHLSMTDPHDPDGGLYAESLDLSASAPRLRLKLRKLDPPRRHPLHAPPAAKIGSLEAFLAQDDPLEGEEAQRITDKKAVEEAQRRMRIEDAAERGVLSQAVCSVFAPEPAPEPPQQYGHWDHVTAHALHFGRLLCDEKRNHRRMAKVLAREAQDRWAIKYKRKSKDELEQEDTDRQITRYKQLVRDVKDAWALVRVEIDKERVAKYEEEQLQLGHKAMDDMFNQAQEILGRGVADSASYYSEDREFEDEMAELGSEASDTSRVRNDDDIMSSSDDSEDNDRDDDDDANLTAEQLRAKYEQLPELPDSSSGDEDSDEGGNAEREPDEGAPTLTSTSDPDLEMDDFSAAPRGQGTHRNGWSTNEDEDEDKAPYINPANVELEQVDDALLDSDDQDDGSGSGSESWPSEDSEDDEDDDAEPRTGSSDHHTDSEDEEEDGGDDVGLIGFLGAGDIAKLKHAAKMSIETKSEDAAQINGTNGHASTSEDSTIRHIGSKNDLQTRTDRHAHEIHSVTDEDSRKIPSALANELASEQTPTEDIVMEVEEDEVEEIGNGPHRSRQNSSPPRAEIPPLLRGTLREYQHGGLDWLANLYDTETNGILADEMGLGKTIQTISLLAYIACFRNVWGPHLVVVPTSVMLNWEMEFKKFLPGFKILTYYGDINERKRKRMGWRSTGKDMYNVVITSYQLILQDAAAFKMRAWHYLILDEAHNIKNFKSQRWQTMLTLRTERRLLLTGTPLQNNIDELWSLLYFLMPAGFAGEGRIANLDEFTLALKNPTSQILDQGRQQLDAEAQKIVTRLHEVLRPYLLRRLKSEVEKQMPGKYEHVVYCKLSKRQRQLYDGFMGRADTKQILSSGNYMSIINCLMSLRKVCNHPDLFETRAIVTSMAMPKSVAAEFEIKDLLIRKRLHEGQEDKRADLCALNLVFAQREHTQMRHARRSQQIRATRPLEDLIERQTRRINKPSPTAASCLQSSISALARREQIAVREHLQRCLNLTRSRTQFLPVYGKEIIDAVTVDWHSYTFGPRRAGIKILRPMPPPMNPYYPMQYPLQTQPMPVYPSLPPSGNNHQFGQSTTIISPKEDEHQYDIVRRHHGDLGFRTPKSLRATNEWCTEQVTHFFDMIPTLEQRAEALQPLISQFTCTTPAVAAEELAPLTLSRRGVAMVRSSEMASERDPFHEVRMRQSIAFPDKRLLQYDCGKLQRLATLLRDLQSGGHRALIFTQMTKVLDILEQFLNIHGHRYLRLDGSTKVEQRQILTDRFNSDTSILAFILSSRSGGLGINLTGADTVIFYDLDWNPAMDKQCQDRAHRIGQTRDVHIYKFVSEYTIEANILRKSNQKRLLDDVIIQKGDFTTDAFNKVTWRDAIGDDRGIDTSDEAGAAMDRVLDERAGILGDARVMNTVEDTEDRNAASIAQKEIVDEIHDDQVDFNESSNATRAASDAVAAAEAELEGLVDKRHVDEYMLSLYREEYGKEPYKPPTDRQKRNRKGQDPHVRQRKKKY